jgi:GTP-binding protein
MDWQAEYDQLRSEVRAYSESLATKPHCVVFTKMDLLGDTEAPPIDTHGAFAVFAVSAVARQGLEPMIAEWWRRLLEMRKDSERSAAPVELP